MTVDGWRLPPLERCGIDLETADLIDSLEVGLEELMSDHDLDNNFDACFSSKKSAEDFDRVVDHLRRAKEILSNIGLKKKWSYVAFELREQDADFVRHLGRPVMTVEPEDCVDAILKKAGGRIPLYLYGRHGGWGALVAALTMLDGKVAPPVAYAICERCDAQGYMSRAFVVTFASEKDAVFARLACGGFVTIPPSDKVEVPALMDI